MSAAIFKPRRTRRTRRTETAFIPSYALSIEFLLRLSEQACECGPFWIRNIGVTVKPNNEYTERKTCLDVDLSFLQTFAGMDEPCWPCQARIVSTQIDAMESSRSSRSKTKRT